MPLADVESLRGRARSLRLYGAVLDASAATELHLRAGNDTWIGPTPQRCLDELLAMRRRLRQANSGLVAAALALERQADAADAG